jgi:predicted RNA methylase/plastocyanin
LSHVIRRLLPVVALLAACGGKDSIAPPVTVASVTVSPATVTIEVGQTVQLAATTKDGAGNVLTGRTVTWGSSNTAVATVNATGLVSGVAQGSVTITATSEAQSGTAAVTVNVPVASVTVSPATVTIEVGQTVQLAATTKDGAGNVLTGRTVTWGSSNTAVATVNATGLVSGVAQGSVTITVTSEAQSGTAAVTVNPAMSEVRVALSSASPTNEYVVAIDGGSYGATWQVTSVTGQSMTSAALVLSVPVGGPYRIRAVDVQPGTDATTKLVTQSGKVENVLVPSGLPTGVSISLAPIAATITAPGSVSVGSPYQISWVYTDPGSVLTAEGRFSSGSSPFTDLNAPCCNVLVQGTEVSATSRQFVANLTAPQTAGTVYFQVINQAFGLGAGRNGFFVSPSTTRGESLRQIAVQPITGVRLALSTPAPTNEFIVAVDGGAFGSTPQVSHLTGSSITSGTLILGVPAGGPYRVRAMAVDPRSTSSTFPIMNASAKADNVTVTTGSLTDVSITLAPISVTITAPTSVAAGSQVQISWAYTDPGAGLDRTPAALDGRVFYSTTPMTQDLTGTQLYATGTALSPTSYQFTITFTAPLTAGTLYYNVAAQTFDLSIPGTSRAGWYIDPSLSRGESLRQIAVTTGTGVQLAVSTLVPTNEFIVAFDGGAFGSTPQVSHLTGSSMTSGTLILGIPAGGPYRVRAIAVDPRSTSTTFPIMSASGKADNVTVTAGSLTDVSITLAPMSVTITAPANVPAGSQVQISWTYSDPGAALDRTPAALDGRVFYDTSPMTQDLTGTQLSATGSALSPTSYQFTVTFTAPITPGTLYFNVAAETFDLAIPGTSRAGWYVDPSLSRGESLRRITVQ